MANVLHTFCNIFCQAQLAWLVLTQDTSPKKKGSSIIKYLDVRWCGLRNKHIGVCLMSTAESWIGCIRLLRVNIWICIAWRIAIWLRDLQLSEQDIKKMHIFIKDKYLRMAKTVTQKWFSGWKGCIKPYKDSEKCLCCSCWEPGNHSEKGLWSSLVDFECRRNCCHWSQEEYSLQHHSLESVLVINTMIWNIKVYTLSSTCK
jgi:hypothetical protein